MAAEEEMCKDRRTFSIDIAKAASNQRVRHELNKAMSEYCAELSEHIDNVADELGVSRKCANNIVYLRSRFRWTQRCEDWLIHCDKHGLEMPSIMEPFEVPGDF
jgi:hypothetical protein